MAQGQTFSFYTTHTTQLRTTSALYRAIFDFQWHPLKNKTHLIYDFIPTWDVQFGKIQKFTVAQQLQQAKKDFIGIGKSSWDSHRA